MDRKQFLERIEQFIVRNEMTPTEFGKHFRKDSAFVFRLRKGRSPSLDLAADLLRKMAEYEGVSA
jgi:hypothetical protein